MDGHSPHNACMAHLKRVLNTHSRFGVMSDWLSEHRCGSLANGITCSPCKSVPHLAYYQPSKQRIVLCHRSLNHGVDELANTVMHEIIHAIDECRYGSKAHNLRGSACTEIRAYHLADCRSVRGLSEARKGCTVAGAVQSVSSSRGETDAREAVELMLHRCMRDATPWSSREHFDEDKRSPHW